MGCLYSGVFLMLNRPIMKNTSSLQNPLNPLGACHALNIGFVFGTYTDAFCGAGPDTDRLSMGMQDAWAAFAHTGDPSCKTIGKWPPYGKHRMTMILGKDCHVEEAPYDDERSAWEGIPF
jgi:para-nitrobenzyl esterase